MRDIVCFQIDPLASLNLRSDSSIYLAEGCYRQGARIFLYEPNRLTWHNELIADGCFVNFGSNGLTVDSNASLNLAEAEAILIRQNPPFDEAYLNNTLLLETLQPLVNIFNEPSALRDYNEKLSTLKFREFMPNTIITSDIMQIESFLREHKHIVLKALNGFGGNAVIKASEMDERALQFINTHKQIIAQEYLASVTSQGDKRVLLGFGEVVGTLNRIPQEGSILANMAAGGTAHLGELSEHEKYMCAEIAERLYEDGIMLAGLDLIDEKLIEINVTSPTGYKTFAELSGQDIALKIAQHIVLNGI